MVPKDLIGCLPAPKEGSVSPRDAESEPGAGSSEPEPVLFSRILKEPEPVNKSNRLRLQPAPGKIEKNSRNFNFFQKVPKISKIKKLHVKNNCHLIIKKVNRDLIKSPKFINESSAL